MVWGCLLLFGPCFFIAGICTYPMAMARRIANEAYNATVDYESLGAERVFSAGGVSGSKHEHTMS